MKYKISEVAKMTGIPVETIRYYESAGIVDPLRINSYRYYSDIDVLNLLEYRKMRNYGMSMAEIKDFFSIGDIESYAREFENLKDRYKKAVDFYRALYDYARRSVITIRETVKGVGHYQLVTIPEKYYISFYLNEGQMSKHDSEVWQCWINEYYSIVEYFAIFRRDNFLKEVPENECLWVNALDKTVVERLNIPLPENAGTISEHKAVYTVVEERGEDFFNLDSINEIKQYLSENNYELDGDIFGKMISRFQDSSVERRYMGIWLPVK